MEILAHNYVLIIEYSTVTKSCCVSVTISSSTGTTLLDHHSSTAAQRGHNRIIPPGRAGHVFGVFEGGSSVLQFAPKLLQQNPSHWTFKANAC